MEDGGVNFVEYYHRTTHNVMPVDFRSYTHLCNLKKASLPQTTIGVENRRIQLYWPESNETVCLQAYRFLLSTRACFSHTCRLQNTDVIAAEIFHT